MSRSIVTYETFHGSAKKVAQIISEKLSCKCINIDTPFEAEDLSGIDNLILVFNFRGPYTAQLTKLYLGRVKNQMKKKNVILVGEGLFSEKEFPIVAEEIRSGMECNTFTTFFVNGQLRVATLFPEEKALLDKFSQITGMVIQDMGQLDLEKAAQVAARIEELIASEEYQIAPEPEAAGTATKWVCSVCGYVHEGPLPADYKCPLCGVGADKFVKA